MKSLKDNAMEVFLLLAALLLIVVLFITRKAISLDVYIQTMVQIAMLSIFLVPQFIYNARRKELNKMGAEDVK